MPEGPEVKVVADGIMHIVGKMLFNIKYSDKAMTFSEKKSYANFIPCKVKTVFTKGKRIFIAMDSGQTLIVFLGMNGKLLHNLDNYNSKDNSKDNFENCDSSENCNSSENYDSSDDQLGKHVQYLLQFEHQTLYYYNPRFPIGYIECLFYDDTVDRINSMGIDVLGEQCTLEQFLSLLKPQWNICKWIMDQSILCGIGNYLKSDILYLAGILPQETIRNIDDDKLSNLHRLCFEIPQLSYSKGGCTLRDYTDSNGNEGSYVPFIYDRSHIDGQVVMKGKTPDGRMSYWLE